MSVFAEEVISLHQVYETGMSAGRTKYLFTAILCALESTKVTASQFLKMYQLHQQLQRMYSYRWKHCRSLIDYIIL